MREILAMAYGDKSLRKTSCNFSGLSNLKT